jgi:DUF1680 family protein
MALLAAETKDSELVSACKTLWDDIVNGKMYVTGGIGSTCIGEAFTSPYDLPNDQAYTETCAGIGLAFFAQAMLCLENNSAYADVIERALYNGILSGLSLDGKEFFYENPLEINRSEYFKSTYGERRFPAQRRVECFGCSCCPPNINRLLASLGNYIYGEENGTLYVNQYACATLDCDGIKAKMKTDYPNNGAISVSAEGVSRIALRIPSWCQSFTLNVPYVMEKGYAVTEATENIELTLDMTPKTVWADPRVLRDMSRVAVMRGPVVYCAEGIDNIDTALHTYVLPDAPEFEEIADRSGLPALTIKCKRLVSDGGALYRHERPKAVDTVLKLIPYSSFANREPSDMRVWFFCE